MSLSTATLTHEWTLAGGDRIGVERFDFDREIGALAQAVSGHVLQIGSRSDVIDRHAPWRALFSHCGFVGMDLQDGHNVDVTADITAPIAQLRRSLGRKGFNAILCRHVLEHVQMPWEAARNIRFLLESGGLLFVTVPWVQGYHEFPHDYWRMSFAGLKVLFPDFSWEMEFYTGAREDHAYRLLWNGVPEHSERTLRIERNLFQLLIEDNLDQDAFDDNPGKKIQLSRHYMPACSVNLIGRKS
jgi:hypothetical protein